MENKMSSKTKWAIGLLIFQALSVFSVASEYPSELYSLALLLSLHEILPHIGAIILIFYNNSVEPKEKFNPLQKWFFALVWIQPAFSFLTYSYLGILSQVIERLIGSCIFPAISCFLLYSDWTTPKKEQSEPENKDAPAQPTPCAYTKPEDTAQIEDTDDIEKATNWGAFIVAIILIVVLVSIILYTK